MTVEDLSAPLLGGSLSAVPRESVVTSVARRLLEHVTSGVVAPGARLPSERQLAATLDVGRSAVREALAALDLLGIVDIRPGSGTYLVGSSSDILPSTINWGLMLGQPRTLDLVELRQFLEVASAQLAAERATDDDVESLTQRVDEMRRSIGDPARFAEADVSFHLQVAAIARNSVLSDVLRSVRSLLQVWVQRTNQSREVGERSVNEHLAVLEAIRDHDPVAAQDAMHSHMTIASGRLRDSLRDSEA